MRLLLMFSRQWQTILTLSILWSPFSGLSVQAKEGDAKTVESTTGSPQTSTDIQKSAETSGQTIQNKRQQIQERLPQYVASGGDLSQIAPRMQISEELMRAGKTKEAEAKLDEVLALLQQAPTQSSQGKSARDK